MLRLSSIFSISLLLLCSLKSSGGQITPAAPAMPSPTATPAPVITRIMPLGDSITAGGFTDPADGHYKIDGGYRQSLDAQFKDWQIPMIFVGSLQDGPADFKNRNHEGHSGWMIEDLSKNINGWMDAAHPQYVILMIGINDINRNYKLDEAPNRLNGLINKIEKKLPKDGVLIVSNILYSADAKQNFAVTEYNRAIPNIVSHYQSKGKKVYFVDMNKLSGIGTSSADLIDGLHPSALGYSKMANLWFRTLLPFMPKPPSPY